MKRWYSGVREGGLAGRLSCDLQPGMKPAKRSISTSSIWEAGGRVGSVLTLCPGSSSIFFALLSCFSRSSTFVLAVASPTDPGFRCLALSSSSFAHSFLSFSHPYSVEFPVQ